MAHRLYYVAVLAFAFVPQLVSAACECGYQTHSIKSNENPVYTDVLESDFLHLKDITAQQDWARQVWNIPAVGTAPWGRNMTLDNVITNPLPGDVGTTGVNGGDPGLKLRVSAGEPHGGAVKGGEVATVRRDMKYGSFRAGIKYTPQAGTCGAFFFYESDRGEIDVEFLSKLYQDPAKAADLLLVIHADEGVPRDELFRPTPVGFRPADGFHEYRFDWTPDRITYYADGRFLYETKVGVPYRGGGLTINHWSNGDAGWSAGPPAQDAKMEFSYIKAYFNSTSDAANAEYKLRCKDPKDANAICKVPDQTTPPDPGTNTVFLSPNKGLPGDNPAPPPTSPPPVQPPAPPAAPQKKVSPDNSCGGTNGYTCLGGENGNCCSSYGFCGSNSTYCEDPKCQPEFGTCGATLPIEPESGNQAPPDAAAQSPDLTDGAPNSATTNNKPRTPDAAGTPPTDTKVSPPLTGECGVAEGYTCLRSQHGDCCSSYGYCGSEESYCGAGCQTAFGRCGGGREDAKTG
ncbi:MAG: hypothetical protein L6R42_005977 [Xanthoria sp. 1 TBL-2021]|nr:MAG: hypothetical protein L6R42_005977 [Xanthoria sp. 1 TBL-2021]